MKKLFSALAMFTAGALILTTPATEVFAAGKSVQVGPAPTKPTTVTTTPGTKTDSPTDQSKDQGPQPGKPIHLVGPSFVMYGDTTFQLGTVDFQKKKALSSVILNAPWDVDGVSLCGTDAVKDKDHNVCVSVSKEGVLKLPAPAVLPVFKKADLPDKSADGSVAICSDCTLTVKTGIISSSSGKGFQVVSIGGHWTGPLGETEK